MSKSRKIRNCEPVNSIFQKYFIKFSNFVLWRTSFLSFYEPPIRRTTLYFWFWCVLWPKYMHHLYACTCEPVFFKFVQKYKNQSHEPVNSIFKKYFINFSNLYFSEQVFSIFANRLFLERPYTFDFDVLYTSNTCLIYMFALANHFF